ncbi:MAG TPA: hypothetical protein VEW74_08140 [Candidatus Nitrosotalea sp.]|nr:hypothetical protein [Candidatus Nitrosotalea sp.]
MAYWTLSIDGRLDERRRAALEEIVSREGGKAQWRTSESAARSYALLELPGGSDAGALRAVVQGTVYDRPIIALALFPAVAEALPALREALAGRGRPAGVLASYPCEGGVAIEWDPSVTPPQVILGLADVELARFASGRTAEMLAPLPPSTAASVAASGLQTPEIEARRILELRLKHD